MTFIATQSVIDSLYLFIYCTHYMHKVTKFQSETQDKSVQITSPVITRSPLSKLEPAIVGLQAQRTTEQTTAQNKMI